MPARSRPTRKDRYFSARKAGLLHPEACRKAGIRNRKVRYAYRLEYDRLAAIPEPLLAATDQAPGIAFSAAIEALDSSLRATWDTLPAKGPFISQAALRRSFDEGEGLADNLRTIRDWKPTIDPPQPHLHPALCQPPDGFEAISKPQQRPSATELAF